MSAVMNMIPQSAIRTTESLPELLSKTSPRIGSAPCVESDKKISLPWNSVGLVHNLLVVN